MKQFTVKRAVEAWNWLHNNEHHIVGVEHYEPYDPDKKAKAVYFQNHHMKMRVPQELVEEVMDNIKSNTRKFDTRMYMLKPAAKRKIGV